MKEGCVKTGGRYDFQEISCFFTKLNYIETKHIDIAFVPALLRRRLSLTTRLSLTAAYGCAQGLIDDGTAGRLVFASRYGEYDKTFNILEDIESGEDVSPAAFSHSVHNTAAGLYAIATGNKIASSSISAGAASLEAAFLEAALMVNEDPANGADADVVLVYADAPLPDVYSDFQPHDDIPHAIGMRLTRKAEGNRKLRLRWRTAPIAAVPPTGLSSSARNILGLSRDERQTVEMSDGRLHWQWDIAHV